MTASLQLKKGFYYVVLQYRDKNNKKKYKWVSTKLSEKNNKRNAEKMKSEIVENYQYLESLEVNDDSMTMVDLINDWLSVKETEVRPNTYETYRVTATSQVIPYFEENKVLVRDLKPSHIQKYYTSKTKEGIKGNTLIKHKTIISGSLKYAISILRIIKENPSEVVSTPKRQKSIPKFYDEIQLKKLFEVISGESIEAVVKITATYGLRRSEVLGLMWDAIDFNNKTIIVKHTAIKCGSKIIYGDSVKEQSSYRTLPLTVSMENMFKSLYKKQQENKKLFKSCYLKNNYVCKWDDGRPFRPDFVTGKFSKILKQNDLPHIRFHDIRHSSASFLINEGFTLKEVQEWLGHADIESTSIYSHLLYKSKENMADRVEKLLPMSL